MFGKIVVENGISNTDIFPYTYYQYYKYNIIMCFGIVKQIAVFHFSTIMHLFSFIQKSFSRTFFPRKQNF